jgi:hypothetical protein
MEVHLHALNLMRDPSRGRTHIVIRKLVHNKSSTELRDAFEVVEAGVFRIADVLADLNEIFKPYDAAKLIEWNLMENDGEGRAFLPAPMFCADFGDEVEPFLGRGELSLRLGRCLRAYAQQLGMPCPRQVVLRQKVFGTSCTIPTGASSTTGTILRLVL